MKIVLEANYRLPSGKPMASRVADIFSLQKREVLAYVRSGRTTPINLNGWINYTTDKLLPFYLYHVAQGWKTHGDRLNQKLPKRKAMLHGLFVKGDRKKKKDEDDKKKYALLGLLALMNPDIIDATRMVARQYIIGMLNTSAKRVNGILAKMREIEASGGQPLMMSEVNQAITNVFENQARLDNIGDTESSRGYHIGVLQVLEKTGFQWVKTWRTSDIAPEKTCPVCRPLDGVTVPLHRTFISIPESGSYKGIYNLINAPPAHSFCRCRLSFSTELVVPQNRQLIGV